MKERNLGDGLVVSSIGLGCMSMSAVYGAGDEPAAMEAVDTALELGITFFDTADVYGLTDNERIVGNALRRTARRRGHRHQVRHPGRARHGSRSVNGRPEYVRQACDASLGRLGLDVIDLYYQHRVDTTTPVEETWGAMAELVTAGKVRHLGISEPSADSLRRAASVHQIAALQNEWSLWSRDIEGEIVPLCRELGIAIVPYSPLGRGFLTGQIKTPEDLAEFDFRRGSPRFEGENFQRNLDLVAEIGQIAEDKGVTPAQLALAWLLAQGDDVVPIPGTKRAARVAENAGAADVELTSRRPRPHRRRVTGRGGGRRSLSRHVLGQPLTAPCGSGAEGVRPSPP